MGFDDEYNLESFIEEGLNTYENYYDWYGPGPETGDGLSNIDLGMTEAIENYPKATITLTFTPGAVKNSQDHLSFLSNNSTNCSETLGPKDCNTGAEWWFYNLEGTVAVSDDASKWTVNQTKSSIVYSGNTKDANGVLHPFSNTLTFTNPLRRPRRRIFAESSWSKTIFWIDAPGRRNLGDDGNPIDSLNWIQNYTMKVCSTVITSICSTQSWYVKLVVNSGGLLSPTASVAALGSPNERGVDAISIS